MRALVFMEENSVNVIWGNIKDVKDIDIDKYQNTKEKIHIDQSVIQTVNGSGSPIMLSPVEADTLEADSIAVAD